MSERPVHWLINARDQLLRFLICVEPGIGRPPLQATMDDLSSRFRTLLDGHTDLTVLNQFTGYRSKRGEYILLVESVQKSRPVSHIVKFAPTPDHLREEEQAYQATVGRNDPVLMRAEFLKEGDVFGLLYEDASQFIGGEVASLEQAFLGAVRFASPAPSSVLSVLKGLYDRLGFVLYQYAGAEDRSRAGFRLAVPHFEESLEVWSGPRPEAPKARRDVNSCVSRGRGLFRDPVDVLSYVRDALAVEGPPFPPADLLVPWMMRGKSHGDLHGRNVKVGIWDGEACWPAVFDHEKMGFNNLVAWDFVKMETELKIRVYQHLFPRSPRYRFIGDIQKFELKLAEQTEKYSKEGGWPQVSDDPTRPALERLEALLMGLRRLAGKHLSQRGQRKGGWVSEWHFLLACYGVQTGRFNTEGHELEAAYVSAGVAMGRSMWDREDPLRKVVAGEEELSFLSALRRRLPCHEAAFQVARRLVKEAAHLEEAVQLLEQLQEWYPHVVEIRSELALAHLRARNPLQAGAILAEAMRDFEFHDEEMHSRFGKIAKEEGHAACEAGIFDAAEASYERSLMHYRAGYDIRQGHYPGVNAGAVLLFLAEARRRGGKVADLEAIRSHAETVLASAAGWPRSLPEDEKVWHPASRAELLLLLKRWEDADAAYGKALEAATEADQKIIRSQLRRLLAAWRTLGESCIPESFSAQAEEPG